MFKNIFALFKVPELRKKVLIVLLCLTVFRLMANIPLPGIDINQLEQFFAANQMFGLFNIFTGGALSNISIAFLGIGPYITASIIFQLLTIVFPSLKEMLKEGTGKEKERFEQYVRIATIPLAAVQGFAMLSLLRSQQAVIISSPLDWLRNIVVVVASSMILMWLGEIITEQKLGNGISLIIFSGIVIDLPRQFLSTFLNIQTTQIYNLISFLLLALFIIVGVVIVSRGERRIPVHYAKQVRGTKIYGGASSYLPLKVNQAGVIPIIFAISILMFPSMFGQLLANSKSPTLLKLSLSLKNFGPQSIWYLIIYFVLVFLFTYFYTFIVFEPDSISENLQKQGGFIPGYRPGKTTTDFLSTTVNHLTLFGAIFLGIIAIVPILLERFTGITTIAIGGTSLLIMVEVAIEINQAIESQLMMREYETV